MAWLPLLQEIIRVMSFTFKAMLSLLRKSVMSLSPRTLTIAPACLSAFMLQLKTVNWKVKPSSYAITILVCSHWLHFVSESILYDNNTQHLICLSTITNTRLHVQWTLLSLMPPQIPFRTFSGVHESMLTSRGESSCAVRWWPGFGTVFQLVFVLLINSCLMLPSCMTQVCHVISRPYADKKTSYRVLLSFGPAW